MKRALLLLSFTIAILLTMGGDLLAQKTAIRVEAMTPYRLEEMGFENPNGFDNVTNGLSVVGKGTRVFLSAWDVSGDTGFLPGTTYLWELVSRPANSAAVLDSTTTQWTTLRTDSAGTYTIRATVNGKDTTIDVLAAVYTGADRENVSGGAFNCLSCHNGVSAAIVAAWQGSGHATLFENGMNGTLSDHWGPSCFTCHTTGWNKSADNGGWDDVANTLGFVDTQWIPWRAGLYDSMLTTDKAKMSMLAGVGCEQCHGPKNPLHASVGTQPKTMDAGICAQCHDEPWRHNIYSMYEKSAHAEAVWESGFGSTTATAPITNFTLSTCVRCHDGGAFVEFTKGGSFDNRVSSGYNVYTKSEITCQTCHDPHAGVLRTAPVAGDTLGNGYSYASADLGNGKICVNCHKFRRNAATYTSGNMSSHWGPHYRGAADVFFGQNAVTFGETLPNSMAHKLVEGSCVGCHMSATTDTGTFSRDHVGGHSWNMEYSDGVNTVDNVTGCVGCHTGITEFSDIMAAFDYDADGTTEPFQHEVEGLLSRIEDVLPPAGPEFDRTLISTDPDSVNLKKVFYNYLYVTEDGSKGAHNPKYVIALLQTSLQQVTDIDFSGNEPVPTEYMLTQNYPNPFNPTTKISVGLSGSSQAVLTVFNVLGEKVATLMDGVYAPGVYNITWDGTDASGRLMAGGIYIYRLQTPEFTSIKKMVFLK